MGSVSARGASPGEGYGKKARRLPSEDIDEDIPVPLPDSCPHCGEDLLVDPERWVEQFQDELVTAIVRRKFGSSGMNVGSFAGMSREFSL
jgi:hypothetical protein